MGLTLVTIIILVIIIIALLIFNLSLRNKSQKIKNTINETVTSLKVLQEFIDTIGEEISVDDKLKKINEILLERYGVRYSTIVVFNGAEYLIKASNVSERHWSVMKNLHTKEIFKDSITSASPKYITVSGQGDKLEYQEAEMERAKSAMFFPLYIDNIYIGYWIIESDIPHAFDKTDTSILEVVRENIIAVLKTVGYQNTIENIYRIDKTTELKSAEYLYGEGKRIIDRYAQSTVCMFNIINIQEINKKIDRDVGTKLIADVSAKVKSNLAEDYILVRYMGPKFAIVFSGIEIDGVVKFLEDIKENIEKITIQTKSEQKYHPKLNFVVASYYKGTGLQEVTKKLETYLDNADKDESNINII